MKSCITILTLSVVLLLAAERSVNAQAGWAVASSPTTKNLNSFDNTGSGFYYIVGDSGTMLRSSDGGSTWNVVTGLGTVQNFKNVRGSSNDICVAVGDSGTFLTKNSSTITRERVDSVTTLRCSAYAGWIFGYAADIVAGDSGKVFYKTGSTWKPDTAATNLASGKTLRAAWSNNGSTVIFVGDGGTILKTTNAGQNWTKRTTPVTKNLYTVCTGSGSVGTSYWASGETGTVLHSTDSGDSWVTALSPTATETLYCLHTNGASAYYLHACGTNGSIFKSTNEGVSWFQQFSPVSVQLNGIYVANQNGLAFGQNGTILYGNSTLPVELTSFIANPTDAGVQLHWTTATEKNNAGFDVERRSENTQWTKIGFVRGSGTTTEGKSYSFTDSKAMGNISYRLKQTDYDGKYEYSNTVEVHATSPKAFSLGQNYPNPFNPSTVISYQLSVSSKITLTVYDVLGREVVTLLNERQSAGNYTVTFDAARFSSGIYFYKLQTGSSVLTKKMILAK